MSKRYTIWAFFDDANGSWHKLNSDTIHVHSFGRNDNTWDNYTILDIRSSNPQLIKTLQKHIEIHGKPDLITFSPPCESWSNSDVIRRCFRKCNTNALGNEVNMIFYNQIKYDELNSVCLANKKKRLLRDFYKQYGRMMIGLDTIAAVFQIINLFPNVDYIIENPQTSKIWEFIKETGFNYTTHKYLNLAHYNNYNSNYTSKPTYFLSNKKLNLKHQRICDGKTINFVRGKTQYTYNEKSSIPLELLNDIIKQLNKGEI